MQQMDDFYYWIIKKKKKKGRIVDSFCYFLGYPHYDSKEPKDEKHIQARIQSTSTITRLEYKKLWMKSLKARYRN